MMGNPTGESLSENGITNSEYAINLALGKGTRRKLIQLSLGIT